MSVFFRRQPKWSDSRSRISDAFNSITFFSDRPLFGKDRSESGTRVSIYYNKLPDPVRR